MTIPEGSRPTASHLPANTSERWVDATTAWSEDRVEPVPARPLGLEMRHLAALEALARERSFRDAATSLGYVQSAVSHQLATMERIVDARLVERARGTAQVDLTEAGEVMLQHAHAILAQFRAAQGKLNALARGQAGTLRVGVFQSVANNLLPRLMPVFVRGCPNFEVVPTETSSDTPLFPLLERGEIDLAFCELPGVEGPFQGVELMEDPFVLLVSNDHELARRDEPVAPADLADLPLVGFDDSRAQTEMLTAMRGHDVALRFSFRCNMMPTVQSLVAEGLGIAIVPYLTVDPLYAGTTIVEMSGLPTRKIWLVWHREREPSEAARRFIEIAHSVSPRFRHA